MTELLDELEMLKRNYRVNFHLNDFGLCDRIMVWISRVRAKIKILKRQT